jgi:uncharacterized FlaG/YvyC family protein
MATSVNAINSMSASPQMTILVAVQSQLAAGKPAAANPADPQSPASAGASDQAAASTAPPTPAVQSKEATEKLLGDAVKTLQDYISPQQTATLEVDKGSGESYVKIVNTATKQLILQIPSAQVLAMAQKLQEMANPQDAAGVLVDQQG